MTQHPGEPEARYERFASRREYEDRLDALIPRCLSAIRIFEDELSRRYGSPRRCELLRAFLLGDRSHRLYVIVHEAQSLARNCPRFATLARGYGHAVAIRMTTGAAKAVYDPFAIVDTSHYLHRFHYEQPEAAQGTGEAAGARELTDRFEALWAESVPVQPGFAAPL